MLETHHRTHVGQHRSLLHPRRGVWHVPIKHVSGGVTVPVQSAVEESEPRPIPEWLTDAWKYRVEAEALHHLEHSLRGLGGVR